MKNSYLVAFACWIVAFAGSAHSQDIDLKEMTKAQLEAKLAEKERELNDLQSLRRATASQQAEAPSFGVVTVPGNAARDPFGNTNFGQQNNLLMTPIEGTRTFALGHRNGFFDVKTVNENRKIDQEISTLVGQIKKSESDEEKQELKNEIQQLLEAQYDSYLEQHEAPLKKLEERLEKLKSDLEARKEAKDDLVRLRLDSIWYQALDLRWPGSSIRTRTIWPDSDPFARLPEPVLAIPRPTAPSAEAARPKPVARPSGR